MQEKEGGPGWGRGCPDVFIFVEDENQRRQETLGGHGKRDSVRERLSRHRG